MIKFITADQTAKSLTLADVEENQFFVTSWGKLAQKVTSGSYNIVANKDGKPFSDCYRDRVSTEEVTKILPIVTKIEF